MKKSPFATAVVALLAKAASVSKPAVDAPVMYLTILVIVAPASVLVKRVARPPVAWAVVSVIAPAITDAKTAFGVPRVAVCALMDAAESVATFESRVSVIV